MTKETRVTSATGGSKGDKIYRFDQIPADPMLEVAARYGLGSTKYPQKNGLDNWRNGYPFSLSLAALERHVNAFKRGEDNDSSIYQEVGLLEEGQDPLYDEAGELRPGVSHLAAVVWHCFFLMHHLEEHPELDDRPTTVLKRAKAGLSPQEEAPERIEEIRAEIAKPEDPVKPMKITAANIITAPTDHVSNVFTSWPGRDDLVRIKAGGRHQREADELARVIHVGVRWTVEILNENGERTGVCLADLRRNEFVFPTA